MSESDTGTTGASPPGDELKHALKAFKKRLKLTRLDHESKMGYGPMTRGAVSGFGNTGIVGITPPNQFPQAVWDELARQGKLKHVGQGIYELMPGS